MINLLFSIVGGLAVAVLGAVIMTIKDSDITWGGGTLIVVFGVGGGVLINILLNTLL